MSRIIAIPIPSGQHDSLDSVPLKAGERLHIRWPSGQVQIVEVALERVYRGGTDEHGQGISLECLKAYIKLPVRGGAAKIYLLGFEAQRIKG